MLISIFFQIPDDRANTAALKKHHLNFIATDIMIKIEAVLLQMRRLLSANEAIIFETMPFACLVADLTRPFCSRARCELQLSNWTLDTLAENSQTASNSILK